MRGLLHHAQQHAVEHLDGHRSDCARGDLGHRIAGVVDAVEDGQKRLDGFGLAHQAHGNFGDQRHGAFRTHQQSGEIVAGQIAPAAGVEHACRRRARLRDPARDWW